jgi:hypothetical protein
MNIAVNFTQCETINEVFQTVHYKKLSSYENEEKGYVDDGKILIQTGDTSPRPLFWASFDFVAP